MKTLVVDLAKIKTECRWDIDYHLPSEEILKYPQVLLKKVSDCADVVKSKKDPTKQPELLFRYIDISCIEVETGSIPRTQELFGEEAPSRARKLVSAFDIVISTCRPTRGAIAVIPVDLHGEICSTGFSVIRAKEWVNPYYLHFALRLACTQEQFRKWSTGSSYPAILDDDVMKTVIPIPASEIQDIIATQILNASKKRKQKIIEANELFDKDLGFVTQSLQDYEAGQLDKGDSTKNEYTIKAIKDIIQSLEDIEKSSLTEETETDDSEE